MLPVDVNGQEVIAGGGLHAAVYAATRVAMGHPRPVVLEKEAKTGGMLSRLANFRMNSANGAGVASVATGPTRLTSLSPSDDLNYLPNAPYQVREESGMVEYPYSSDMGRVIAKTLTDCAVVYTGAQFTFDRDGVCYSPDRGYTFGQARRIIFAGGLVVRPDLPAGEAIMSGYDYMRQPVRNLAGKKIALVGSGDTAAQVAEHMLGQGVGNIPVSAPTRIHWYGGGEMPASKKTWMETIHARWAGIGRHLPDYVGGIGGVIKPYLDRGDTIPMGKVAMVNGQMYDLVVLATGFVPAPYPIPPDQMATLSVRSMTVGKYLPNGGSSPRIYVAGTAAKLGVRFEPFQSRFYAARSAIYNLAPRTAALAASLP